MLPAAASSGVGRRSPLSIFITGASRGLGRALAVECARGFGGEHALAFALFARDAAGLSATAAAVRAACPSALVVSQAADLGALSCLEASWHAALGQLAAAGAPPAARAILINNAGSLGPLAPLSDAFPGGADALRAYVDLNLTSPALLTMLFLRGLQQQQQRGGSGSFVEAALAGAPPPPLAHHVIVNISSLAAVQAMPTWGMYSVTRAGRDMLTAVAGADGAASGGGVPVKTLNWAPGPCDTDMQRECRESATLERASSEYLNQLHADGAVIDPAASAAKCVRALRRDTFASGAHLDYYDAED